MKGRCADENHAGTGKTRFLNDWLSSYQNCTRARFDYDLNHTLTAALVIE